MKIGLVLEGGASRTLFSCGVMDKLLDENIIFPYIIGVSAGISYAVSYASGQKGRNLRIAKEYMGDKRYMGAAHMFSRLNKSYYNLKFVFDTIPNELVPFDYQAYADFKGNVIAGVTNIRTGECEYYPVSGEDREFTVLRASCALPILFKPVKMLDSEYMDGGICDPIPFEKAFEDGCDKVVVILTRERSYRKKEEPALKMSYGIYRKYPKLTEALRQRTENYNVCLERLSQLEREGKAYVVAPNTTKGFKRTENDSAVLEHIYKIGYYIATNEIEKIKEFAGV